VKLKLGQFQKEPRSWKKWIYCCSDWRYSSSVPLVNL
jgi:hypothetical protein